ncbi:MAG TPA: hypothetical protein VKX39_10815 [Bryobacteraceae bacterium]|nr:hypothetical protein [Bryobacteraceae bacterium]
MACPFFVPVEPLGRRHWRHAPRFPLGEAYRGVCQAAAEPFTPPESRLEEICNCGYARLRCDRFPAGAPDAVRFSLIAEDKQRIRIVYVLERDHAPHSHGAIEYSKADAGLPGAAGRLEAQARAFVASHLRRAGQPAPDSSRAELPPRS